MGTAFRLVKLCPSSRREPLVLFLKLLISLTIYTRAVSSDPLEEITFQIPALGRIFELGSLYDARANSFSDTRIFKSDLPRHLITTSSIPRMTKDSQIIKKESDKFKIFGVGLDTAASIQTGIVQPEGAASLMSEDMTSSAGVTGVFLQTFETARQTMSILDDQLRNYYTTEFEVFEGSTHVVTGIHWGGSVAVTFTDTLQSKRSGAQRSIQLGNEMTKLKRSSRNMSNKQLSFEMHVTSDVSPHNALPAPTSLREIQTQISQVQEFIKITNSGLGVPIKFTLTPISVLKKYLNVTTTTDLRAYKLDERILREYLNIVDDIKFTSNALTIFEDNSNCVSNEVRRELEILQNNFQAAEQDFEILYKNGILGVKSGEANNAALSQLVRNYANHESNPKSVRSALALHEQASLKVNFCSQLNEEYPDIQYFGSAPNLISKIYQNHNKPTYVLFKKSEFEEMDRVSHENNLNIFLNLLYKPSNALFIVDCDLGYSQCQSINRTVIKQIRQGKYTFDDVRLKIKILEMENKTEIVECNRESGITGALCVSTIEITSAKSRTKPLNMIANKPEESRRSTKVVGGNTANPNEFPFQVLFLKNATGVHCGGTILNENSILTAAHCLHEEDAYRYDAEEYESWTIVVGDHNWQTDEGTEQRRKIREVHIHKNYIPIAEVNDIAIVQLDRPLQWSTAVQPILLPDADYEASGNANVTGWGRLQSGGTNPLVLQKVNVPIVDRADCVEAYEEAQVFVSVKMLCAGHLYVGGVDACQGDSGGPLSVQLSNGSSMLVGVVSGGIGCARPEYPGIYMQVSKYVDWINDTLSNFELDIDECLLSQRCQNGGTCLNAINGYSCICVDGFAGTDCEKLIKCEYPGTCERPSDPQICVTCRDGFVKDLEDDTRCKYANQNASLIIAETKADFQMTSLNGRNKTQIIQNRDYVYSMDYNFRSNTMFWFSWSDQKIYTAPINGEAEKKSIAHVSSDSSSWIYGIAVDWIHEHLYWVDDGRKELAVCNFNGSMKKVLFNVGLLNPLSIAVNPLKGWMYWTDKGKNRIERAGLDGSRRQIILSTNIKEPHGLVIDFANSRLFWSQDSQGGHPSSIWSSELDGSDPKLIFSPTKSQMRYSWFRKIATFDKFVYIIDDFSESIYKVNKCNLKQFGMIYKSRDRVYDLKIYDATVQPDGENFCSKRIGRCSHFCFPVPSAGNGSVSATRCACPDGFSLSANKQSCV